MHSEIAQRFTKANYTFKNWNILNLLNNLPLFALYQLLGHLDRPLLHLFCGRLLHSFYHTIFLEKIWTNTIHIKLLISSGFTNITQILIKTTLHFHTISHCFPYHLLFSSDPVSNPLVHILSDINFHICYLCSQTLATPVTSGLQPSSAAVLFTDMFTCEYM